MGRGDPRRYSHLKLFGDSQAIVCLPTGQVGHLNAVPASRLNAAFCVMLFAFCFSTCVDERAALNVFFRKVF